MNKRENSLALKVSGSAFSSQAHLNVKMRRGGTIKARQMEIRADNRGKMHSFAVTNMGSVASGFVQFFSIFCHYHDK